MSMGPANSRTPRSRCSGAASSPCIGSAANPPVTAPRARSTARSGTSRSMRRAARVCASSPPSTWTPCGAASRLSTVSRARAPRGRAESRARAGAAAPAAVEAMIRRYGGQRSLFEAALGADTMEPLLDPTLRRLDAVLADEHLGQCGVPAPGGALSAQSRPRAAGDAGGCRSCGCWCCSALRGWTFDETEREVRASLVYRWVTHIYLGPVPDAKTLVRQSLVLGEAGVRALHERIVTVARTELKVQGRRARVDTTVVETNVHYPTDATLLMDGLRVLTRTAHRVAAATGQAALRIRNRLRAANRRVREIGRASRGQHEPRARAAPGGLPTVARAHARDTPRCPTGAAGAGADAAAGRRARRSGAPCCGPGTSCAPSCRGSSRSSRKLGRGSSAATRTIPGNCSASSSRTPKRSARARRPSPPSSGIS